MTNCPNCNFLSDPETGDIYDSRYPCPKCKKQYQAKQKSKSQFAEYTGFGHASTSDKAVAALNVLGFGAAGYLGHRYISGIHEDDIPANLSISARELLPQIKKVMWMIPAFAVPPAVTLMSGQTWPGISQIYYIALVSLMAYMMSGPLVRELKEAY